MNHFKPYPDIKAELQAQLKKMEGAMAAGNQDEIISFYTNDCRLLPPGAPMKVGEHGILFICLVGALPVDRTPPPHPSSSLED